MKKNKYFLMSLLMALASCTTNEFPVKYVEDNTIMNIEVTAPDFECSQSRTDFSISPSGASFKWASNDTIGVFPDTGDQISFPMSGGAGTNSATFTGGGWLLKGSSIYYSYYPFSRINYISSDIKSKVSINYFGETQNGDNSTIGLGGFDYMAAKGSSPASGFLNFSFTHLGALVMMKVTMPISGAFKELSLSAEESIFATNGTLDLTSSAISITPSSKSNSLLLKLENITASAGQQMTFYMMLPPTDCTGKTLTLKLRDYDNVNYSSIVTSKNFEAGKAYQITASSFTEDTSTKSVTLNNAGTLLTILGGDNVVSSIKSLTVRGTLNGTDIKTIRSLTNLEYLDLTDALFTTEGANETYTKEPNYSNNTEYKLYTDKDGSVTGWFLFAKMPNLRACSWPKSMKTLTYMAFSECYRVSSVIIPEGVTCIQHSGLTSLSTFVIPNTVKTLGGGAFWGCSSLKSVVIPSSVTVIENQVFENCSSLQSISIPSSVTSISNTAFAGCTKLKSIYMYVQRGQLTSCADDIFNGDDFDNITLYILKGSTRKDWYDTPFYKFKNVESILDSQK